MHSYQATVVFIDSIIWSLVINKSLLLKYLLKWYLCFCMPENSKAFLKCFEFFCAAEGLVLIKGGVYSVLCIGINSAATIFLCIPHNVFVRQVLSLLHYFLYHKWGNCILERLVILLKLSVSERHSRKPNSCMIAEYLMPQNINRRWESGAHWLQNLLSVKIPHSCALKPWSQDDHAKR